MRSRGSAAFGSIVFFLLAPGTVAGVLPWLLTDWRVETPLPYWWLLRLVGGVLIVVGAAMLIVAFVRFVTEGLGTPAPVAPPDHLVVGGLYRYVRNPMYLAVLSVIAGQALVFGQLVLVVYSVIVTLAFVTMVRLHEEPSLRQKFGEQYEVYRQAVPGWLPRPHPWNPS